MGKKGFLEDRVKADVCQVGEWGEREPARQMAAFRNSRLGWISCSAFGGDLTSSTICFLSIAVMGPATGSKANSKPAREWEVG